MRPELLRWLRCPLDRSDLDLKSEQGADDGHVIAGSLDCPRCGRSYPIRRGVPDLVPDEPLELGSRRLDDVQDATAERFGFEWRRFDDWGWRASEGEAAELGSTAEESERAFWGKSLLAKDDLAAGSLVLDAGCGNGRFSHEAARTGAEVIGVDLGDGVFSAFENTRSLPNCHVVRGDLFRLPFPPGTFDRIFSIGVLHHTGDARAAFDSLLGTLRPGGLVVAHVYGVGLPTYEILDRAIRAVTTRLSIASQLRFSGWMAGLARWLGSGSRWRRALLARIYPHVNLLPTEHHMFDWWAAPVATHHRLEEVIAWFEERGLEVVRTRPPRGSAQDERRRRRGHGPVTVLGRLSGSG